VSSFSTSWEPDLTPKPHIERCSVWVVPANCAVVDGHQCKLSATHERDGRRVCSHHLVTAKVRYLDEPAPAAGRRAMERT
jgi:hypothetical protein